MPIRLRLTILYTSIISMVLSGFVIWYYSSTMNHLMAETDGTIENWARITAEQVKDKGLGMPGHYGSIPRQDVFRLPGIHTQILNSNGQIVYCSENLVGETLPISSEALKTARAGRPAIYTILQGDERVRVINYPVEKNGRVTQIVQAGKSLHHIDVTGVVMKNLATAGIALCVIIAGLISYASTSRALLPVALLTDTAKKIAASKEFSRRVEGGKRPDEMGRLAEAFNSMLGSLESVYKSHKRFLADASHELRSPLTSLSNNINFLIRAKEAPDSDRDEALRDMALATERMGKLVSDLLFLARSDVQPKVTLSPIDLSEIVTHEYRAFKSLAGSRRYDLEIEAGKSCSSVVNGDEISIRKALQALIENAIRYTAPEGEVAVKISAKPDSVVIEISDNGIGIPEEDKYRVFDEFYRSPEARAYDTEGVGLGLSIVKKMAELHSAGLSLSSTLGEGTVFKLVFHKG